VSEAGGEDLLAMKRTTTEVSSTLGGSREVGEVDADHKATSQEATAAVEDATKPILFKSGAFFLFSSDFRIVISMCFFIFSEI
jgi:hypothetical protein